MQISCFLGIHSWNGCKCTDCGKIKNEGHDWSNDCGLCAICGTSRTINHKWEGCKCKFCSVIRDSEHDWSSNCEMCTCCGMTRLNAHNWIGCTCRLCGKKRYGDKLIEAAKNGNDDVVSELINNGVDVNTIDFTGSTALIYAADRGKLSIVKKLVTAGANLNIKNNKGQSSCWVAAGSGHADILTELITHGGDPNAKDNSGRTVLIIASLSAAKYGCIAILETLLNVKIDINARCTEGISALSYVLMSALSSPNSFNGLTDVVKLLLSNGAYKSNDDFMLIMKIAAQTNNTELFNFSQTDFKNKKTSKPIVSNSMNNKGRATPGLEELKNIWARTYMDGQLFTKEVQTVGYRWTEEVPLPWGSADVMVRGEDKFIISIKTVVSVA